MEQPIKPKRRYHYTVRPSPRVEKIDAKTFPSKFEGKRKSGSKINFLRKKGTSNRELDRFLVTRLYRATRESSCTIYERAVDNWVAEKRGSPSVALSRWSAMRAALPWSRMREPAVGGAWGGRGWEGEGDMPQQPWKEGWHPESEWGAGCTTLPPPMQPAARPTAEITCYHPGSKVAFLPRFLVFIPVFWNDPDATMTLAGISFPALRKHCSSSLKNVERDLEFLTLSDWKGKRNKKGKKSRMCFSMCKLSSPFLPTRFNWH